MVKDTAIRDQRVNEVKFANHIFEFIRFYGKHVVFCDEIAGLKERVMVEDGKTKTFTIGLSNFIFAIKRLDALVIDNLHYLKNAEDTSKLTDMVESLEEEYLDDTDYATFSKLQHRNAEQETYVYQQYLKYLLRCLMIGNRLFRYLQTSLMIGTKDVKKAIEYYNDQSFFEKLSYYRDEVSDSLANFKLRNSFQHLKKLIGFYYTYRIFVDTEWTHNMDNAVAMIVDKFVEPKVITLVTRIKMKEPLSATDLVDAKALTKNLREVLKIIYLRTNQNLAEKNIYPNPRKSMVYDLTGI